MMNINNSLQMTAKFTGLLECEVEVAVPNNKSISLRFSINSDYLNKPKELEEILLKVIRDAIGMLT